MLHEASKFRLGLKIQTWIQPLKVTNCILKKFSEAIFISFYTNFPYHFFSQLLFDDDDVCIILALNGLLLSCRVAALSERRVKQNQSKVEDTLSENRQSKVEEDFANFFDETRMDALEKMQTSFSFKEQLEVDVYFPRLLCLVFEVCLAFTVKLTLMKCRCFVQSINN